MDSSTTQLPLSPIDGPPIKTVPPPASSEAKPPLIGDAARRRPWLWLTHVLPTALVLLSGQYTYSIAVGQMNAAEREASLAQALVLAAVTVISAVMALRKRPLISNLECLALLAMSSSVMAIGIGFTEYTLPWDLPEWIVSRNELLYRSFCFGMLGAFYPLLLLTSYPVRRHAAVEFVLACAVIVACPIGLYVISWTIGTLVRLTFFESSNFPDWLVVPAFMLVFFVAGIVLSGAVIRCTLIAYTSVRRAQPRIQQAFMFLIAVIAPIGGLWLNRDIPFPTDFQALAVYLLSLVNGGLLILPVVRSIFWHRVIWLAQCVMFPFSAYFFLIFLPWLPATPVAMIVMGAGALMLTPLVLGLVHGYRVIDGYREEVRDGQWWKPALLCVAAISVLPAAIGYNMWQDRQSLNQALDYIYSPDYRKDITYPGDLDRLKNSLQHMRNMKQGIFLPFISPAYNYVVFHNLVLPDEKIETLEHAFFGGGPAPQTSPLLQSRSRWSQFRSTVDAPPTGVVLNDVQVTAQPEGATTTSHLTLVMQNPTGDQSEFVTTILIPEGVYVAGFGLQVGKEMVPGQIVEKKVALWVYEKIKNVERRDPGLLIYKNRNELELHVFPFAAGETRRAEITLVHPNGAPATISIGYRLLDLNPGVSSDKATVTSCQTSKGSIAIAEGPGLDAYSLKRQPYLDIMIDCSEGASYTAQSVADCIQKARTAFPDAKLARVCAVNFEDRDVVSDLLPVEKLDAAMIQKNLLVSRGGFLEDRFLKRGLLLSSDLMQKGDAEAQFRPQFVVITPAQQTPVRENNFEAFLQLAPDARIIYAMNPDGGSHLEDMAAHEATYTENRTAVMLWKWNGRYAVSAANSRSVVSFSGDMSGAGQPLLYDSSTGQFSAPPSAITIPATTPYANGVRTWAAQDEATLDPALLQNGAADLIGLSKQTGILIPDSSYIVVENSAQRRIMEEKEKLKLKNNQAFELEEPTTSAAPEPATVLYLIFGVALLLAHNVHSKIKAARSRSSV